ncbi:3-oxoacyl-ACP synthase [Streptomyces sp. NBRC 14336]|uniref:beta-ketoacyl-[acyl-carrier-protein] synthase family protein n=1 Tax=Streptomyces sp. NBRC 14336 TaxID=3030992 RepID=UPI0024A19C5B|nr:beta-ketoacyl-[acyl-carrier-protein] synthase family protein [Streptomyces sp. NBRC 14336]WBO79150.1 beta-ketoacyl-[acyl-carrier-protein] synthase family protein [Streptomyces sp. SBE_14.2]GLW49256.1 3-oxoacyl-ACP synthase [Streptomyces sp. NBRC 14336]
MAPHTDDVLVTGVGALTPLGATADSSWAGLLAGRSGVRDLGPDWPEELPVRIAGTVEADPAEPIGRARARKLDRGEQLAVVAAREAWQDAGVPQVEPERLAVVVGTGIGGVLSTLGQNDLYASSGMRRLSPYAVPMLMPNGPAAWVSMELGARAGARAPVSACASGAESLALGLDLIRAGRADVVVAGGTEATLHPFMIAAFAQMKALSAQGGDPAAVSRPFDAARSGFVIAEGAALFVLERADFARARGARVYGALAGAAVHSSAHHITASDAEGQVQAMRTALADAGVEARDIGHVHAHATSTPSGDIAEAEALTKVVGDQTPVTATKSMTGHMLGASGAFGAMSALLSLHHGVVPAVRNLDEQDPEVRLDVVRGENRTGSWDAALANSFGFGGHNVSLVMKRA